MCEIKMSIKNKLSEKFLTPNGNIGRAFNVFILLAIAVGSIGEFYLVKFIICSEQNCTTSSLLKLINSISPLFLVYGVTCLIIGKFIAKSKDLALLYADSITLITAIGFLITGILIFSIK